MQNKGRARRRWLPKIAMLLVVIAGTGCGGGSRTYPVEGKVVFKEDNAPFPGGMVVFEPSAEDALKVSSTGEIKPDGTFRLTTYKDGDGAVEGPQRVLVVPPPTSGSRSNPQPLLLDRRFSDFATSGLEFTVTRGKNEFTIVVEKSEHP